MRNKVFKISPLIFILSFAFHSTGIQAQVDEEALQPLCAEADRYAEFKRSWSILEKELRNLSLQITKEELLAVSIIAYGGLGLGDLVDSQSFETARRYRESIDDWLAYCNQKKLKVDGILFRRREALEFLESLNGKSVLGITLVSLIRTDNRRRLMEKEEIVLKNLEEYGVFILEEENEDSDELSYSLDKDSLAENEETIKEGLRAGDIEKLAKSWQELLHEILLQRSKEIGPSVAEAMSKIRASMDLRSFLSKIKLLPVD